MVAANVPIAALAAGVRSAIGESGLGWSSGGNCKSSPGVNSGGVGPPPGGVGPPPGGVGAGGELSCHALDDRREGGAKSGGRGALRFGSVVPPRTIA